MDYDDWLFESIRRFNHFPSSVLSVAVLAYREINLSKISELVQYPEIPDKCHVYYPEHIKYFQVEVGCKDRYRYWYNPELGCQQDFFVC